MGDLEIPSHREFAYRLEFFSLKYAFPLSVGERVTVYH